METVIASSALVVGLLLLWSGRRRLEVSSFQATLLSIIEVAGFIVAIVALGWIGVAIFIAICLIAALAWSVILAIKKQSILVDASVQGADISVEEAEEIWQWMKSEKSFAIVPPLQRAELIRELAGKARSPDEIRAVAAPIAQLSVVFGCDPIWLAPRFDQLLRLYGKNADESMEVADSLTRGSQLAAASFEEMVEAKLAAGGANPSDQTEGDGCATESSQFRENLRMTTEFQIRQNGEDGVRLDGGPMNGWLVRKDAPSLTLNWHKTWPPSIAKQHEPGRYEVADSGAWAAWVPLT